MEHISYSKINFARLVGRIRLTESNHRFSQRVNRHILLCVFIFCFVYTGAQRHTQDSNLWFSYLSCLTQCWDYIECAIVPNIQYCVFNYHFLFGYAVMNSREVEGKENCIRKNLCCSSSFVTKLLPDFVTASVKTAKYNSCKY